MRFQCMAGNNWRAMFRDVPVAHSSGTVKS